MDEQSVSKLERMYTSIRNLPESHPKEFGVINSGFIRRNRRNLAYSLMTTKDDKYNGIFGRVRMWQDRILDAYHNLPVQDMSRREEDLEVKVSNNFFRSRFTIKDKSNGMRLKIKSPLFSSLFSYLFGSFVRMRMAY